MRGPFLMIAHGILIPIDLISHVVEAGFSALISIYKKPNQVFKRLSKILATG